MLSVCSSFSLNENPQHSEQHQISGHVAGKLKAIKFKVFAHSDNFPNILLVFAANNHNQRMAPASGSSLFSLRVLAHQSRHPRGSKMKVSGWEGEGGGRGGDGG